MEKTPAASRENERSELSGRHNSVAIRSERMQSNSMMRPSAIARVVLRTACSAVVFAAVRVGVGLSRSNNELDAKPCKSGTLNLCDLVQQRATRCGIGLRLFDLDIHP
jgi:hypothetical protein